MMLKGQTKAKTETAHFDSCGLNYIDGETDSFNCTAGSTLILTHALCHTAAAGQEGDTFEVDPTLSDAIDQPEGCFKSAASKYFFNPVGLQRKNATTGLPIPVAGTPVCQRPIYTTGVAHNNGTVTCDAGYELINDENACQFEGNCDPEVAVPGVPFRITLGNASDEANYPKGCFVNNPDGKLYFNKITDDGVVWNLKPGNDTGTPVCKVSR